MLKPVLCMFRVRKINRRNINEKVIKEGLLIYLCLYSESCGISGLKTQTVDPVLPRTGFPVNMR